MVQSITQLLPEKLDLPVAEQTFKWFARPYEFMQECTTRYGDSFTVEFTHGLHVFFSDPEVIRQIFSLEPGILSVAEGNASMRPYLGEHSFFLNEGQHHYRNLLLASLKEERIRAYGPLIRYITHTMSRPWSHAKPFAVQEALMGISLEIILRIVLGNGDEERLHAIREKVVSLIKLINTGANFTSSQESLGRWDPRDRLHNIRQQLDEILSAESAKRRDHPNSGPSDILDILINDHNGESLTEHELSDYVVTLLLAGSEPVATSLAWALYWIHHTPGVREALVQEISSSGTAPDGLKYLRAVCQETLRISPVVPVICRMVKQPIELMGYKLDPGVYVVVAIYLTHHREEIYSQPACFTPERFWEHTFTPYEYLPFGGAHQSIGMALAYEMEVVLATLLSQFTFKPANQRPVHAVRRGVTVGVSEGGRMTIKPR